MLNKNEKDILIAPDFVINAGGVMQGIEELVGGTLQDAIDKLPVIAENLKKVYGLSRHERKGTYSVAKKLAIS